MLVTRAMPPQRLRREPRGAERSVSEPGSGGQRPASWLCQLLRCGGRVAGAPNPVNKSDPYVTQSLSPLTSLLRCLDCDESVDIEELVPEPGYPELGPDGWLACRGCGRRYPIIAGTVRMMTRELEARLAVRYPEAAIALPVGGGGDSSTVLSLKERIARSYDYEWEHFGGQREEWRKNFLDYLRPHDPESLADKLVLDVGAGSGRHSTQAAQLGARVVAVDLGSSIDVARRNLPAEALTVQADAEHLPFERGTFDFVMSIGVIHHLPDPEGALRSLVPLVAPGGRTYYVLAARAGDSPRSAQGGHPGTPRDCAHAASPASCPLLPGRGRSVGRDCAAPTRSCARRRGPGGWRTRFRSRPTASTHSECWSTTR